MLFAALLVGSSGQDAVPAAVLASAAAWLTLAAMRRRGAARVSGATAPDAVQEGDPGDRGSDSEVVDN